MTENRLNFGGSVPDRVLKSGGKVLFSVWGDIHENDIREIGGRVVGSFIGDTPIPQDPGPFTMQDQEAGRRLMQEAGCAVPLVSSFSVIGVAEEAAIAVEADGSGQGRPARARRPAGRWNFRALSAAHLTPSRGLTAAAKPNARTIPSAR